MTFPHKVLIVQNHIAHYRVQFYKELHKLCQNHKIELNLIYNPFPPTPHSNDYRNGTLVSHAELPWATPAPMKYLKIPFLTKTIAWQQIRPHTKNADLIILQQELKYLANHALLLQRKLQGKKTALWGHGKNFQSQNKPERIKQWLSQLPTWWFSYTKSSTKAIQSLPFPPERITTIQNSVDTKLLKTLKNQTTQEKLQLLRETLQIPNDAEVGLFCGGLHQFKQIPLLIEASTLIKKSCPNFYLLVIGDGPEKKHLPQKEWIKHIGPKNDTEKVPYWLLSKTLLMPGCVGLAAVDSLCLETPCITTNYPLHSPEFCYLQNNHTCLISSPYNDPTSYAKKVLEFLRNPTLQASLKNQCRKESENYSAEIMAQNFLHGILKALNLK